MRMKLVTLPEGWIDVPLMRKLISLSYLAWDVSLILTYLLARTNNNGSDSHHPKAATFPKKQR
jgi:hypothetical protein